MKHITDAFSPIGRQTDSCLISFRYYKKDIHHTIMLKNKADWVRLTNSASMRAGYERDLGSERSILMRFNGLVLTGLLASLKRTLQKWIIQRLQQQKNYIRSVCIYGFTGGELAQCLPGWNPLRTSRTWVSVNNKTGTASHRVARAPWLHRATASCPGLSTQPCRQRAALSAQSFCSAQRASKQLQLCAGAEGKTRKAAGGESRSGRC